MFRTDLFLQFQIILELTQGFTKVDSVGMGLILILILTMCSYQEGNSSIQ